MEGNAILAIAVVVKQLWWITMTFTSRNSPCTCSSGKHFKHCCGAVGARGGIDADMGSVIVSARTRLQAGDLQGAEVLYLQSLSVQPDDPECLYRLGLIYLQTDRVRSALSLILRAGLLMEWRVADMRNNLRRAVAAVFGSGDAVGRSTRPV